VANPISLGGQVVAVIYADQGAADDPQSVPSHAWRAALEVLALHAARCLEVQTAFKAARVLTDRDVPPTGSEFPPEEHEHPADEDEAARRYARLLVSEIKLYHEAAVVAGRKERDLASRLSAQITRARVMYEQRVPAQIRTHVDHFHAELVRTLANGDATLLGQMA
jgi:hypothetical protein